MLGTVYKITSPKGRIYVGSTKRPIHLRFNEYRRLETKLQTKLYNSLVKYGPKNHIFEIIGTYAVDILLTKEYEFGMLYNVLDKDKGLNCRLPKIDGDISISEESRQRIGKSRKSVVYSESTKLKMKLSRLRFLSENPESMKQVSAKLSKHIKNLDTGEIYVSAVEASKILGIRRDYISKIASGAMKSKNYNLTYL